MESLIAMRKFARLPGGANIGLEALVLWICEVRNGGAAVEECGKRQTMLGDVRAKAQPLSTCATRSRCCWQSAWLESAAVRRRSSARWRRDPVGCRCSRSSDWSQTEQWCSRMASAGVKAKTLVVDKILEGGRHDRWGISNWPGRCVGHGTGWGT